MTDLGPTDLGPYQVRPDRVGPDRVRPDGVGVLVCMCVCWCVCVLCWCVCVWVGVCVVCVLCGPDDRPFAGPPKFSRFFPLSRPHFRSFFLSLGIFSCLFLSLSLSLGGLLVEFWWCFGLAGPSNVRVFALGLSCESPLRPAGQLLCRQGARGRSGEKPSQVWWTGAHVLHVEAHDEKCGKPRRTE